MDTGAIGRMGVSRSVPSRPPQGLGRGTAAAASGVPAEPPPASCREGLAR
jgi:hypothetical protein